MGLVEGEDYALNAAGKAYARTKTWLEGAVMTNCTVSAGRWVCNLKRNGADAWLVWTEADTQHEWPVSESWSVTHVQPLAGEPHALVGGSVAIGQSPVLLSHGADWSARAPAGSHTTSQP